MLEKSEPHPSLSWVHPNSGLILPQAASWQKHCFHKHPWNSPKLCFLGLKRAFHPNTQESPQAVQGSEQKLPTGSSPRSLKQTAGHCQKDRHRHRLPRWDTTGSKRWPHGSAGRVTCEKFRDTRGSSAHPGRVTGLFPGGGCCTPCPRGGAQGCVCVRMNLAAHVRFVRFCYQRNFLSEEAETKGT